MKAAESRLLRAPAGASLAITQSPNVIKLQCKKLLHRDSLWLLFIALVCVLRRFCNLSGELGRDLPPASLKIFSATREILLCTLYCAETV